MGAFRFEPAQLPPEAEKLRAEVRAFLAETMPGIPAHIRAGTWSRSDEDFSRRLAAACWNGMSCWRTYWRPVRPWGRTGSPTGRARR